MCRLGHVSSRDNFCPVSSEEGVTLPSSDEEGTPAPSSSSSPSFFIFPSSSLLLLQLQLQPQLLQSGLISLPSRPPCPYPGGLIPSKIARDAIRQRSQASSERLEPRHLPNSLPHNPYPYPRPPLTVDQFLIAMISLSRTRVVNIEAHASQHSTAC